MPTVEIEFDGGSRPNPGSSAIGYIVESTDWRVERSAHIGESTNNKAEYHALIQALELAAERGSEHVVAKGDSQLIVNQVRGDWDVNDDDLTELHGRVQTLTDEFESFEIRHISREENSDADDLVDNVFSE
jgi:ribonuclease HI